MNTIHVCTYCGSANIQQDAWVHYNDRQNVQTFDDLLSRLEAHQPGETVGLTVSRGGQTRKVTARLVEAAE